MDLDALKRTLGPLVSDFTALFGSRLRSIVAYGGHDSGGASAGGAHGDDALGFDPGSTYHTLVLVDHLTASDLAACAARARDWASRHYATPLLMTASEFTRSLDVFPFEYGEIVHHHALIAGENPFERVTVAPHDLRRACEAQAKSHLLHLREAYIESGARPESVVALVASSARPFEALLRNVAHLQGAHVQSRDDLASHAERAIGMAAPVVHRVIALLHPNDLSPSEATKLFPAYVEAVERLATYLDEWNA